MMLVINRRAWERLRLVTPEGDEIWVRAEAKGHKVKLMIVAPRSIDIKREELLSAEEIASAPLKLIER